MIAAGMVRSRWISRVTGSIMQEASKILRPIELAGLRRSISHLPAPLSNYAPERTALLSLAVLKLVAADKVWNVGYRPSDSRWDDFQPVLQWIERIHRTEELRAIHPGICGRD